MDSSPVPGNKQVFNIITIKYIAVTAFVVQLP